MGGKLKAEGRMSSDREVTREGDGKESKGIKGSSYERK
jgi:hypothetical protein